jgi:hypothetical protein
MLQNFTKKDTSSSICLKIAAMEFIVENFIEVQKMSGWCNFMMSSNSSKGMEEILGFTMRKRCPVSCVKFQRGVIKS